MYLRYSNMQYAIWKLHLCSFYEKKVGAIFGILIVIATTYMSPVFFCIIPYLVPTSQIILIYFPNTWSCCYVKMYYLQQQLQQ